MAMERRQKERLEFERGLLGGEGGRTWTSLHGIWDGGVAKGKSLRAEKTRKTREDDVQGQLFVKRSRQKRSPRQSRRKSLFERLFRLRMMKYASTETSLGEKGEACEELSERKILTSGGFFVPRLVRRRGGNLLYQGREIERLPERKDLQLILWWTNEP